MKLYFSAFSRNDSLGVGEYKCKLTVPGEFKFGIDDIGRQFTHGTDCKSIVNFLTFLYNISQENILSCQVYQKFILSI